MKLLINILCVLIPHKAWRVKSRRFLKRITGKYDVLFGTKEDQKAFKKTFSVSNKAPLRFSFIPPLEKPLVSIIIPVYNQYSYTHKCLWTLLQNTSDVAYEVILADDCSDDETETINNRIKNIKHVRTPHNMRFLRNCNYASAFAVGKYILFLNNDTQVQENWLKPLVDLIEKDKTIGLVGSKLLYADGTLQEAGGIIWSDATGCNYGRNQQPWLDEYSYVKEVDYISGAAIMLPRELWQELKGFDETFAPAYYEDTDLAFRIRHEKNLRVVFQPTSKVVHFEGKSNGIDVLWGQKKYQEINAKKFLEKWRHVLQENHCLPDDIFLARDRSQGKKTLLFIDHCVLTYDQDTGSRASLQYMQLFVKHGVNVKFLPHSKGPKDYHLESIRQMGVEVLSSEWYTFYWQDWLKHNGQYIDYVYLNRPDLANIYIAGLRCHTSAKIIYQGHDLHHLRLHRQFELSKDIKIYREANKLKLIEQSVLPKVDVVTFFSDTEVDIVKEMNLGCRITDNIPLYIFDIKAKQCINYHSKERRGLLFVGGYKHLPNIDAALWFSKEVLPLIRQTIPELKLHLVGSSVPKEIQDLSGSNIIVHGYLSDDSLNRLYQEMRVCVVPLRCGAGIKGKILESIYNKVPVVTTSIGAEGIPNITSILTIADGAQKMAAEIVSLYQNESRLQSISDKSHPFIAEHYSERTALEKFKQWIKIA